MIHYDVANDFATKMSTGQQQPQPQQQSQPARNSLLSVDQQLQLMNTINNMVRGSQFTSQLANTIFTLCAQLKTSGLMLEQTHKNELNKVFTSLRQACCRDNGQLGTPCRLKIMELVELRAMMWRTNLAHSQYYVNRPEGQHDPAPTMIGMPTTPTSLQSTSIQSSAASTPTPPPPSSTSSASQQQFVPPPPNPMMFAAQDPMSAAAASQGGIFFIPAASTWMNPLMPMPPNPFCQQPSMMLADPHHQMFLRQRGGLTPKKMMPGMGGTAAAMMMMGGVGVGGGSGGVGGGNGMNASNKTLQLRHEMIIRNSDSGKIMGVKGRRVAAVEQLTGTVISFQKVDAKSKERTLTITASSMEDIERAKDMIIDTIRRNMSPIRTDLQHVSNTFSSMINSTNLNNVKDAASIKHAAGADAQADVDDDDDNDDIKLEQTSDGKLTFCCDDPELLAAAQEALSAYLRVRTRPSAEEREKKKERRKSMPLQQTNQQEPVLKPAKTFHGSTPNLADGLAATTTVVVATNPSPSLQQLQNETLTTTTPSNSSQTIRYDRDLLMTYRDFRQPMPSEMKDEIIKVAPDILA